MKPSVDVVREALQAVMEQLPTQSIDLSLDHPVSHIAECNVDVIAEMLTNELNSRIPDDSPTHPLI